MIELILLRKNMNITRTELAKYLNCSTRQVNRYENKECDIPLGIAIKWAKKLKLSMNQFARIYK